MKKARFFDSDVSYVLDNEVKDYSIKIPFDPPRKFPELPICPIIDDENVIYRMVRDLLIQFQLDNSHIGTSRWNPFRNFISPGDSVVIKPNLATDSHYFGREALLSTIVHGSIIRPILDYVYLALQGKGSILIADTPLLPANFEDIMSATGISDMVVELTKRGYTNLSIRDLRPHIVTEDASGEKRIAVSSGDPLGYVMIDLGSRSCFSEYNVYPEMSYYTLEDPSVDHIDPRYNQKSLTDIYHNSKMHKYVMSKTILDADVIVNIAKLKTHCKAGVTLSLKNMIGTIGTKICMPHHRPGSPPIGDSFPEYPPILYSELRKLYRVLRNLLHIHKFPGLRFLLNTMRKRKIIVGQQIEHGNWKGNDTIWRTILDVNRIIMYADKRGIMQEETQRQSIHFIDGIIAQQGDAPISGEPIKKGIIFGGYNPVILDAYTSKIMGIDPSIIKTINKAKGIRKWKLISDDTNLSFKDKTLPNLHFVLPKGWR